MLWNPKSDINKSDHCRLQFSTTHTIYAQTGEVLRELTIWQPPLGNFRQGEKYKLRWEAGGNLERCQISFLCSQPHSMETIQQRDQLGTFSSNYSFVPKFRFS